MAMMRVSLRTSTDMGANIRVNSQINIKILLNTFVKMLQIVNKQSVFGLFYIYLPLEKLT